MFHATPRGLGPAATSTTQVKATKNKVLAILTTLMLIAVWPGLAYANNLKSVKSRHLPDNKLEIILGFSATPHKPLGFTIQNPAKIALDFTHTHLSLKKHMYHLDTGPVRSVAFATADNRTRLVFNLTQPIPYKTRISGHHVIITLALNSHTAQSGSDNENPSIHFGNQNTEASAGQSKITNITFHRGKHGNGLITLTLSNTNQVIDLTKHAGKLVINANHATLLPKLRRRMIVSDFGTPIQHIDSEQQGHNAKLIISATGDYKQLAYQTGHKFTVDIKPVSNANSQTSGSAPVYKGKRISLNFQNIPVRSVLQLLADFSGLNIVVSNDVSGNVTLRLENVPWDQALAIILQSKGLAEKRNGNVIMIAPSKVIEQQDRQQIKEQQAKEQLAPLHTEIFQIRYAKAQQLAALLKSIRSKQGASNSGNNQQSNNGVSGLSSRGSVVADKRTNSLIIRDTNQGLNNVSKLIQRLDVPVKQVLIGSRLVVAKQGFSRDLGVNFGSVNQPKTATSPGGSVTVGNQTYGLGGYPNGSQFNVNLPASKPTSTFGLTLVKLSQTFNLSLQLSAAEDENRIRQISNPRVITANDKQAMIEQGVQIPYQQASSSGATNVSFKTAALKLLVTPHITPNNHVLMDLDVSNDSVGGLFNGVPSINTQEVKTQVMVNNGQTVVLGGIYQHDISKTVNKVPFFGDLPVLGALFRETNKSNTKTELLIFITPKIINHNLSLSQ